MNAALAVTRTLARRERIQPLLDEAAEAAADTVRQQFLDALVAWDSTTGDPATFHVAALLARLAPAAPPRPPPSVTMSPSAAASAAPSAAARTDNVNAMMAVDLDDNDNNNGASPDDNDDVDVDGAASPANPSGSPSLSPSSRPYTAVAATTTTRSVAATAGNSPQRSEASRLSGDVRRLMPVVHVDIAPDDADPAAAAAPASVVRPATASTTSSVVRAAPPSSRRVIVGDAARPSTTTAATLSPGHIRNVLANFLTGNTTKPGEAAGISVNDTHPSQAGPATVSAASAAAAAAAPPPFVNPDRPARSVLAAAPIEAMNLDVLLADDVAL